MDVSIATKGSTRTKKPSNIVCRKWRIIIVPDLSLHLTFFHSSSTVVFPESMRRQATVPNAERASRGDINLMLGGRVARISQRGIRVSEVQRIRRIPVIWHRCRAVLENILAILLVCHVA